MPSLQAVAEVWPPVLVVTQPDRPAGRGLKPRPSPVKLAARELGLEVYQPASINSPDSLARLGGLGLDLIVVADYGQLLRRQVLEIPRLGCVNLHASLLPRYRGAAPVAWAILNGDRVTGVTVFVLDEGMDTGPILLQEEVEIAPDETRGELEERLSRVGAGVLVRAIQGYSEGKLVPRPQPPGGSRAPLLKREDGLIDWTWPADKVHNWVRGMNPWPSAFSFFRGRRIKLHRTRVVTGPGGEPGEIVPVRGRLYVACGEGAVEVLELQPEGKRRLAARDFLNGYRPQPGERLLGRGSRE